MQTVYNLTTFDIINLAVGLASLLMAILAGGLSIYFFVQSKATEKSTSQLLEGIKVQTEVLQKLTGKWMEKLINYSTQSQPVFNDTLTTLVTFIQEMPSRLSGNVPSNSTDRQGMIIGFIGTYYYAAIANTAIQMNVPDEFNVQNETHNLIKNLLDSTASDVQTFRTMLQSLGQDLNQSPGYNFFQSTETYWLPSVKTFEEAYAEKLSQRTTSKI